MDHLVFEVGTALILIAIASLIANKIKFSIIPFLIVLGMIVGPHAPTIGIIDLKFIESTEIISFLAEWASCSFFSILDLSSLSESSLNRVNPLQSADLFIF